MGNCTGWAPIKPSKEDKLSDGTAKQILAHDEFGAKQGCPGFKPAGRGLF